MEVDLDGHPGTLVAPADARALLVLAHGAGAGRRHVFFETLVPVLAANGVATLRYDFPYMAAGKARPDRPEVAEACVRTVWTAAARLDRVGELPRFAGGKSFGGRMTSRAHAAAPLPGLRGIVFLGFPLHPPDKPEHAKERSAHLHDAGGPLLFLQGDRDDFAPLRKLRPLVKKLGTRATLHVIKGGDHGFDVLVRSGRTDADVMHELATTIATWMDPLAR